MFAKTIKCDICRKQKAEVNHWWIGFMRCDSVTSSVIQPWNDEIAEAIGAKHLCGQECVTKFVSEWMQKVSA